MKCLALAAPGTLELVAAECRALGLKILRVDSDGVHVEAAWLEIARTLVHLRVATRLLLHLGTYPADDGDSLYRAALRIDWAEWLDVKSTFGVFSSGELVEGTLRPDGKKSKGLTDHRFVNVRVKDAIADDMMRRFSKRPNVDRDAPTVALLVRGRAGHWSFYLDLADPALFMRGVCEARAMASLKETLAAAMVDLCGWNGKTRLIDPLCGAGTIGIEAAGKVLGIAPGCTRTFACERWPHHGKAMARWLNDIRAEEVAKAKDALQKGGIDIWLSDREPDALDAAAHNLGNAGLQDLVHLERMDARDLPPQPSGSIILTNPPYGERIGGDDVGTFYAQLGHAWRGKNIAQVWALSGATNFAEAFGWKQIARHRLNNGAIDVELQGFVEG